MKTCSCCKNIKPFERFSVNDYGRPISHCKEGCGDAVKRRLEAKKNKMSGLRTNENEVFPVSLLKVFLLSE